jgi:biotin carboxyl carrier protein
MKRLKVKVGDAEHKIDVEELGDDKLKIKLDNEEHIVKVSEDNAEEKSTSQASSHQKTIKAPMPGTISQILVKVGDKVKKGTALLTLLAMKMENTITAPVDGTVKEIKVKCHDAVEADQVLIILE